MKQLPSPLDFSALLEMFGGDKQIVASLLSKFVDELTTDLAASEQAITDQDAEALRPQPRSAAGRAACARVHDRNAPQCAPGSPAPDSGGQGTCLRWKGQTR